MELPASLSNDLLTIYLNDHLGGATAGSQLAHRAARENRGGEFGPPLERVAREIAEDRESLLAIIDALGRPRDRIKVAAGRALEVVGRLKPNGRLVGYSPLSRVLELETLISGVEGKQALWHALLAIADAEPALDAAELERLAARAAAQQEQLADLHRRAAALALVGA